MNFCMREMIKRVLASETERESVSIAGWVRTRRDSKAFSFLEINDGSCLANMQVVADAGIEGYGDVDRMLTGASVHITGRLIPSLGQGQKWELQATSIRLIGEVPADYPLQKKGHTLEFLRSISHLRPRTNLHGAVSHGLRDPHVFPRARFHLRAHADSHRQRLRRCW